MSILLTVCLEKQDLQEQSVVGECVSYQHIDVVNNLSLLLKSLKILPLLSFLTFFQIMLFCHILLYLLKKQ